MSHPHSDMVSSLASVAAPALRVTAVYFRGSPSRAPRRFPHRRPQHLRLARTISSAPSQRAGASRAREPQSSNVTSGAPLPPHNHARSSSIANTRSSKNTRKSKDTPHPAQHVDERHILELPAQARETPRRHPTGRQLQRAGSLRRSEASAGAPIPRRVADPAPRGGDPLSPCGP